VWERPVYALRDERYKLIYDSRTGEGQLFDLQADPPEQQDLAARDPVRAAYYRQTLQQWTARLGDRREGTAAVTGAPTPEQCENFHALGYVHAGCAPAGR
jgi:hypothetical protein